MGPLFRNLAVNGSEANKSSGLGSIESLYLGITGEWDLGPSLVYICRHSTHASSSTSGCFFAIESNLSAASPGSLEPCSQAWTVLGLMFSIIANTACEQLSLSRIRAMSLGDIAFGGRGAWS